MCYTGVLLKSLSCKLLNLLRTERVGPPTQIVKTHPCKLDAKGDSVSFKAMCLISKHMENLWSNRENVSLRELYEHTSTLVQLNGNDS